MKMVNETFTDMNGRKFRLYTVRSFGKANGFGILNRYTNVFLSARYGTRQEAWADVKRTESK
jgi:hypothetical protein